MANRRDLWRDFLGRFEPSADPRDAVERGFYVPRPGRSLAEQLALRFELKPAASHLVVGGVGSGKTTQLLVARDRVTESGDVRATYVDVSLRVDPNRVTSAELLAVVGLELVQQIQPHLAERELVEPLRRLESFLDPRSIWAGDVDELTRDIESIHRRLAESQHQDVLFIDSLDRMSDLARFAGLIETAVAKLRSLGIGVILVGPLTALYGIRRTTLDRFDRTWHIPTVDVEDGGEGHTFLRRVLAARDAGGLLTDAAAERLAKFSGGVLRDLIALAQTAGEEAYVDGAERVEVHHVDMAADLLGRKHLFAIDSYQLAVLQRVREKGTFVQTSEKDLALLATRRVLEYTNGHARFAVHPTIEPLLAQLPEEA